MSIINQHIIVVYLVLLTDFPYYCIFMCSPHFISGQPLLQSPNWAGSQLFYAPQPKCKQW